MKNIRSICSPLVKVSALFFIFSMSAQGMGILRPQTNAPPPVAGTNIPALPPRAELSMTATMTDGTGVGLPFIGSKAMGVLVVDSTTKSISGTLTKLTLPTGMDADVKGSFVASGYVEAADHSVITGRYPVKAGNGWVDVSITRLDASNCSLWVRADVSTQLGPATGVAVGGGVLRGASSVVINTNAPSSAQWDAKENASYSKDYKIKTVVPVPGGVLVSTYNRNSREDSFLDFYDTNWKKTMLYKGSEETLGLHVIEGATVFGKSVYFQAEIGKNIIIYDTDSRKVRKGISLPSGTQFNVENCAFGGTVVFGGSSSSKTAIYDALNGRKLFDSPLNGLVSGLTEHGGLLWWVVAGEGVCRSDGWTSKGKFDSITSWGGSVYVGSQVDGWIYRLEGGVWAKFHDTKCSNVNQLRVAMDGAMLVAASNPDTFLRFTGARVEQLARYTDQPVKVSGEQFDTSIADMEGGSIVGARANDGGAKVLLFTRKGDAPPPVVVPPVVTPPASMPADLPATGQSGFIWKPNAEGGGGGLVVLFNEKLRPFVKSATINGKDSRQQVPPYSDGRGAIRWNGKTFPGAVTLDFNLSDGRKLRYAIPNGLARTEKVRPTVVK